MNNNENEIRVSPCKRFVIVLLKSHEIFIDLDKVLFVYFERNHGRLSFTFTDEEKPLLTDQWAIAVYEALKDYRGFVG